MPSTPKEQDKQHKELSEKALRIDNSLRPKRLHDFIGQAQVKKNLKVFIKAAMLRSETLDHVLLSGPPGLGKTTLSNIIASEMDLAITGTAGPLLERQGDLAAILTSLTENQVLFIDEIHRMNRQIEEVLYGAMEDFKLDVLIGRGPGAKAIKVDLPKFTLIGATTKVGMLSSPLRDRFGIPIRLGFYQESEILAVILRSAEILKLEISPSAAMEIAKRARGTPRIANRYLRRCYDFAVVGKESTITLSVVKKALNELKIDTLGLDDLDLHYLTTIATAYEGGPVGLTTLTSALSEDKDTLEITCEPYLMQIGFLQKTARGRKLTDKAWDYLKLKEMLPRQTKDQGSLLVDNYTTD